VPNGFSTSHRVRVGVIPVSCNMLEQLWSLTDKFVDFCVAHEWIGSKSLVLLTPSFNEAFADLSEKVIEAYLLQLLLLALVAVVQMQMQHNCG
jgi:hypothetical protein